ncbi:MAG: hypothetical protein IKS54_09435 [Erysipelotrichaceae bacterium]|nr:hypothetical protein [Erysipelotrichaceae bacterium]
MKDKKTGKILFTMDIDVNRPALSTKIYEIENIRFSGATITQMIADKLSVLSIDTVFRRIKDFIDLYYISQVFIFDPDEIRQVIENNRKTLNDFHGFVFRTEDLRNSGENSPSFMWEMKA